MSDDASRRRLWLKPLYWVGSSRDDIRLLPDDVRVVFGHALHVAQLGGKDRATKPLKGFGSAGVLEIVEDHDGETYRAVYTVKFTEAIYVLHVFQKKSRRGSATPKADLELIRARLRRAQEMHTLRGGQNE